jgi:hypothetical protein
MEKQWYTEKTSHAAPIKNTALLNNKLYNVEVLTCDYEPVNAEDPYWKHCRSIAKFKNYSDARQYAEHLAKYTFFWTGGVLIR